MGAYLSSPVTEKVSTDKSCAEFTYGASSMQGWRISQEDAHNCIPEFDKDAKTSFFAVYDGHGGPEVAQYCSKFLPDCVKDTEQYKDGELGPALVDAFLKFDSTLVQDEVIKELKLLAGVDENDEEEEDEDAVNRNECAELKAEADLPLDELLAKYKTSRKNQVFQSPAVKAKRGSDSGSDSAPSSSTDVGASDTNSSASSGGLRLTNGLADNENNMNKEKELQEGVSSGSGSGLSREDNGNISASVSGGPSSSVDSNYSAAGGSGSGGGGKKNVVHQADSSTGEAGGSGSAGGSGDGGEGCSSSSMLTSGDHSVGSSGDSSAQTCSKSDPSSEGVSSSSCGDEEGGSGSGSGTSKSEGSSKNVKNGLEKEEEDMDDDDSDDDEEDEDEWQDLSGEEEEEEDEDEEEGMDESSDPIMDMSNEEPGSDSGCTACVVLMRGNQMVVANAGDSRCVLSRGGRAVELSFDHKPEDDIERTRIEKAGGKVTADGRVNGGLNLSRALGDHFYKRKDDLPPEEQMITALPDIQAVELDPEDQFFVLACDGIWNSMSSQECIDFVAERLKDPSKRNKPSLVCEEMFDHCLAANTHGDGTGCDNMTCVIVVFHSHGSLEAEGNGLIPSKRNTEHLEESVPLTEKKPRLEGEESSSTNEEIKNAE